MRPLTPETRNIFIKLIYRIPHVLSDIAWSVLFAGAAALFSLLSVVVGRLNYADDELSRQNRIENRILDRGRQLEYQRPPRTRSSGLGMGMADALADKEPEYSFQVSEVLVSENRGWGYLANKVVHGFGGQVSVVIVSQRWKSVVGTWNAETPPDFERIEEFDFEEREMTCELREGDSTVVVTFQHADVERVSDTIEDVLDHIESELASELVDWETER